MTNWFSTDYFSARERFRAATATAGGRLHTLPLRAKGPGSEDLTIDIACVGAESPRRILVHSSGLHGVEGFAGCAIQLQLLNELPNLAPDAALVIVHGLNPYGMSWLRRVNENNIDLNRNFGGSYAGAPPMYAKLHAFLNPPTPPASDAYYARAAYFVLRYGMNAMKQSVVGGQYEYPKGLFFGGKEMEEGPRKYEAFLKERYALVDRAIAIDVHTGIGKYSQDILLVDAENYGELARQFGERVTPLQPDRGAAYRVQGGLESMLGRVFTKTRPTAIGQEFGTYSGIKVLHALREENRWHHYGQGTLNHPTKRTVKETFSPQDETWRQTVLRRGGELIRNCVAAL